MSIIHDALKKAEKTIDSNSKDEVSSGEKKFVSTPKAYLLYVLVICFGLFIGNIFFGFLTNSKSPSANRLTPSPISKKLNTPSPLQKPPEQIQLKPSQTSSLSSIPSAEVKKESQTKFILNGVFFSQEEGSALINNRIVKVGDEIGGAIVKQIKLNEVELEVDGQSVKLSSQQR